MDSGNTREFLIPFAGLKEGKHYYEFNVGSAFFSLFDYQEAENGAVKVELELEKQTSMLVLNFMLKGYIVLACDRCGEDFQQPVRAKERQLVKF